MSIRYLFGFCLFSLIISTSPGCKPRLSEGTGAELKGRVTLDGKPITIGQVMVFPFNGISTVGNAQTVNITSDGTYSLPNLPIGFVKIVVRTTPFKGRAMANKGRSPPEGKSGGAPVLEGTFVEVPALYEDPDKTTFNLEITGKGVKEYDLDMKSR